MTDQTAKKRDIRQRQEKDDWMLDFEIRKKEEKYWKMLDLTRMSLIFRKEY